MNYRLKQHKSNRIKLTTTKVLVSLSIKTNIRRASLFMYSKMKNRKAAIYALFYSSEQYNFYHNCF